MATNDYELWKKKATELQEKVDAFFVLVYAGLKDNNGNPVSDENVAQWYVTHINIPEASMGHLVKQGMLCGAHDSAHNQGYEAAVIAHDILVNGADPSTYPPHTPKRGALVANKNRAKKLGIHLTEKMGIEEYIE